MMRVERRSVGSVEDLSGEHGAQGRKAKGQNDAAFQGSNDFITKSDKWAQMRGGVMHEEESPGRRSHGGLREREQRHELIHRSHGCHKKRNKCFQRIDCSSTDECVQKLSSRVGRHDGKERGLMFVLLLFAVLLGTWTDEGGTRFFSYLKRADVQSDMADRDAHRGKLVDSAFLSGRFIVRFRQYKLQNVFRDFLTQDDRFGACGLRWIDRQNPAATKFPTDFGLVDGGLDLTPEYIMSECLSSAKGAVKDVFWDHALKRRLHQDTPWVSKPSGRLQTRSTFDLEDNRAERGGQRKGRGLAAIDTELVDKLNPRYLWGKNFTGKGIKMGVFDTGIRDDHPDVEMIEERTNWTHEDTLADGLGHGSFVAGVIAGTNPSCPGLAPQVSIHTFRVFTNDQVSFTSWFLDAFNYAIATEMDVVNLSIGGPDYLDAPFVDKVLEVTSSGIIMISAIGNDGPTYGTMNNPADQNDVIGVGGISYTNEIAGFSSRGMTTWELPLGYGRSKPDIMTFGKDVRGSAIKGGCRSLSGTSVASPVVAGAVCLLASTVPAEKRGKILNPASMKQVLVEGASRLPHLNMFEQGQGSLTIQESFKIIQEYEPRASIVPAKLNLTDCPYSWPYCVQPIYSNAMPLMFNATILNGMGVAGMIVNGPTWKPGNEAAKNLDVRFTSSEQLWPWSGHVSIFIRVLPEAHDFAGTAEGRVELTVESPPALGESQPRRSTVGMDIILEIIPKPERSKRILWDQFRSIKYPPAYIPRDDLSVHHDILDWHGDHPHTNFHTFYDRLRDKGYFLEILSSPATCFDANEYGAMMIVDSEEEFYPEEIEKIYTDVTRKGMGLIVFSEWYDSDTISKLRFYDDNTRSWWDAATGGSNIPALNDMLKPFGAAFAGGAHELTIALNNGSKFDMAHGSALAAMPKGSYILAGQQKAKNKGEQGRNSVPALGLADVGKGRLVLYGDSNCLDSAHRKSSCEEFSIQMIDYVTKKHEPSFLASLRKVEEAWGSLTTLPQRVSKVNFSEVSFVLQHPLRCYANAPLEHQGLEYQTANKEEQAANVAMQSHPAPVEHPMEPLRESQSKNGVSQSLFPHLSPNQVLFPREDIDTQDTVAARHGHDSTAPIPHMFSRWKVSGDIVYYTAIGSLILFGLLSVARKRRRGTSKRLNTLPVFSKIAIS